MFACSDSANTYKLMPVSVDLQRTRSGTSLPTYKSLIRSGLSATTNMVATAETLAYKPGFVAIGFGPAYQSCPNAKAKKVSVSKSCGLNVNKASTNVDNALLLDAQNKAAIGIRGKIKQQSTQFSGMVFLAELRETIHMLRNPLSGINRLTEGFFQTTVPLRKKRRSRKISKSSFGQALSEQWLEYSLGMAPLMRDISDIAQSTIEQYKEDRIIRLSYTGYAEKATSNTIGNGILGSHITANYSSDDVLIAKHRYTVGYRQRADVTGSVFPSLQRIYSLGGFNLSEIVPTVWEALPWSFLLDYFSNIGNVLNTHLVSMEDVVWVNSTSIFERTSKVHSGTTRNDQYGYQVVLTKSMPSYQATFRRVERAAGGIPFGTLRFELPSRATQLLNIAALAHLRHL
jgi:hypothetical protein